MTGVRTQAEADMVARQAVAHTIREHSRGFMVLRLLLADIQAKADTDKPVESLDVDGWAIMLRWIVTTLDDDNDRTLEAMATAGWKHP